MAMSTSPPPLTGGSTSPQLADAEGFLLLTIPNTIVKQNYDSNSATLARGELQMECVSLPIPPEIGHQTANPFSPSPSDPPVPTHDFWLVIKVGDFELPLIPKQELQPIPQPVEGVQYRVQSTTSKSTSLTLILPKPTSSADLEDLESFEVLIRQYKSLGPTATALEGVEAKPLGTSSAVGSSAGGRRGSNDLLPEDVRGKLVLVNEDNGEIIGEMDQTVDLAEDAKIAGTDRNQPVVLDFGGEIEGYSHTVQVKTVSEEDMDDWMLRGAHHISKGILSFGDWSSRKMTATSERFIKNSTPAAKPMTFSPTTKNNIRKAHNATAMSVGVTKQTVSAVNNVITKIIDKGFEKGVDPTVEAVQKIRRNSQFSSSPPPIPPRNLKFGSPPTSGTSTPSRSSTTKPPIPPKPNHLSDGTGDSPKTSSILDSSTPDRKPSLPPRLISPGDGSAIGRQIPVPSKLETAAEEISPPPYTDEPEALATSPPSAASAKKRGLLKRIILSAEVVLSSLDSTTSELVTSGTAAAASAAHHKYGAEAGQATALLGGSVRNVVVMYVDVKGVGRKAIVKRTAKGVLKTRLKNGEEVELQGENEKVAGVEVEAGEVEQSKDGNVVIGLPQFGGGLPSEKEKNNDSTVVTEKLGKTSITN